MSCACDPVPAAILFDLDGTLVDSTASVERGWATLGAELGLADGALDVVHGMTAEAIIRSVLPDADDAEIARVIARHLAIELADVGTVAAYPGAPALIAMLDERGMPWGIATSGVRAIAQARLDAAGIARPRAFVTANDISRGKPDPEPYLVLGEWLGADAGGCLVVEDAPPGVASGRAAGALVCAVTHTHSADDLARAHHIVDSLDGLSALFLERGYVKGAFAW